MKFQLVAPDQDYSTAMQTHGGVNGGTVWLDNIARALRWHGHDAELVFINKYLEADYVIAQSEVMKYGSLKEYAKKGGKIICLLSHFNPAHQKYASLDQVRDMSRLIFTPWEGELLQGIEYPFLPHAYGDLMDDKVSVDSRGSVVFAGNSYPLRHEGWFDRIGLTRIYKTLPWDMPAVYRGADVCVNLHGDFQKNIVSCETSRISDKKGMMVNERFWNILGAGGVLVTDWVPQMERWFSKDELIIAHDKREFEYLVKYYKTRKQEGLDRLARAREKVRKMHTYKERVADMLKYL